MYNWLVRRILFPLDEWRTGSHVGRYLTECRNLPFLSRDELLNLQWTRVKAILQHAFDNVPFYRRRFQEARCFPQDIRSAEDLRKIPPLTKSDIMNNLVALRATTLPEELVHRDVTGGTTGFSLAFYRDNDCYDRRKAITMREYESYGWSVGEKVAFLWPAIQDLMPSPGMKARIHNALIGRTLILYPEKFNEQTMSCLLHRLRDFRPFLLKTFPNSLALLAKFASENGWRIRPECIVSVGEPLLSGHRELFGEVFQCAVFNVYCCRECGTIAFECPCQGKMHINSDNVFLEFCGKQGPVNDGEVGEILVTDLLNRAMPLIRYKIGDMGTAVAGICQCGRNFPFMHIVAGRVSDFLISPIDGSLISGAILVDLLMARPEIGRLQLIQHSLNTVEVRVEDAKGKNALLSDWLLRTLKKTLGQETRILITFVEDIPKEKSGKYRLVVSKIAGLQTE